MLNILKLLKTVGERTKRMQAKGKFFLQNLLKNSKNSTPNDNCGIISTAKATFFKTKLGFVRTPVAVVVCQRVLHPPAHTPARRRG